MLRRLIEPITLWDDSVALPDQRWEAPTKVDRLLDGIQDAPSWLASLMPASWNHIVEWLRLMDGLRRAS